MAVCRAAVHVRAAVAVRAEEHSALQDALTTTTQTPEAQLDLELRTFMDTWQVRRLQDALTTTTQTPEAQLDLELRTFMDTWQVRRLQDALTTTTQTPEAQLDLELRTFMDTWQVRATPGYTYTLWMFMLLGVIWDATCCRKAAPLTLPRAVRWAAAGETRY
jgi:long-subunit fatty acid transport protein